MSCGSQLAVIFPGFESNRKLVGNYQEKGGKEGQ